MKRASSLAALIVAAACSLLSLPARAFCGFYVADAEAKLQNDATMTVLARDGTRTVLSMRPRYKGPPKDFAMVVPVPVVLQEGNVKTLSAALFDRLESLSAPRLVEYWEVDPCSFEQVDGREGGMGTRAKGEKGVMGRSQFGIIGVIVEAEFTVGEYEIVILSARDSGGLDRWLREHDYRIPEGAEAVLRPYVQAGSKFFVAKVDAAKVAMGADGAMLSPLRMHYDSESFQLPIRLGMLNSPGVQDLVVLVLAKQRYELANYENLVIPTNLDVVDSARKRFGELYAALFDRTLAAKPNAAVTEYAWDSSSCDPCPTPAVTEGEMSVLGGDVLPGFGGSAVLTRVHMRYGKDSLGEDLVFRTAPPIAGGDEASANDHGARPADDNRFQARYVIRHAWSGPIRCSDPDYGHWGDPPEGRSAGDVRPARDLAAAERGRIDLAAFVTSPVPSLGIAGAGAAAATSSTYAKGALTGAFAALVALLLARALRAVRRA